MRKPKAQSLKLKARYNGLPSAFSLQLLAKAAGGRV